MGITSPLIADAETPLDYHDCNAWCRGDSHVDVWHFHNYTFPIDRTVTEEYLRGEGFEVEWLGPAEVGCDHPHVLTCERFTVRLTFKRDKTG